MSFLDDVKRQEKEKHRESEWFHAVELLCRFIRQYLRKAEAESQLIIKPDLLRVDKILLDRLTIFLNGETVTVAPLSLSDVRAPVSGGCVLMSSTNGVTYHLQWNGSSTTFPDNWQTVRVEDSLRRGKAELDQFTVFSDPALDTETLSEDSLDRTLLKLFGLAQRNESPNGETEQPRKVPRPLASPKIPGKLIGYYRAVNGNGKGPA
ncbi:MAG: hypothetical protein ACREQN_08600 [Candidatus Binataceae bacterium]